MSQLPAYIREMQMLRKQILAFKRQMELDLISIVDKLDMLFCDAMINAYPEDETAKNVDHISG